MIKAITFDIEGTIINTEPFHRQAWANTAEQFGINDFDTVPTFVGTGDEFVANHLCSIRQGNPDTLINNKRQRYFQLLKSASIKPRPGWLEFYQIIKQQHIPFAIGSLTPKEDAKLLLTRSGLNKLFDANLIVLCQDAIRNKPTPDVYLETARRLKINPSQQLIFEDSRPGVTAAQAAGSPVIAIPIYYKEMRRLLSDATSVVSNWQQASAVTLKLLQSSPLARSRSAHAQT